MEQWVYSYSNMVEGQVAGRWDHKRGAIAVIFSWSKDIAHVLPRQED